jgi:hypothetical protein
MIAGPLDIAPHSTLAYLLVKTFECISTELPHSRLTCRRPTRVQCRCAGETGGIVVRPSGTFRFELLEDSGVLPVLPLVCSRQGRP